MNNMISKPQAILMVDDNEDDFEAVARTFKKVGITNPITLCKTGKEALDFLKNEGSFKEAKVEKPAFIMLDLNMPGMDGRRILQLIKEDAALRRIPVIIWTTSSNENDINICYQLGANAYMQKPVDFETLLESVKHLKEYWLETVFLPVGD